jgi:hypothetical protein
MSSTLTTVELIVVVVPFTIRSPVTVRLFLTVVVPEVAPIVMAVPALAKLTVVAVVSNKSNEVEPVVRLVVIAGDVNVFTPAKVCAPVVTIPETVPDADGVAATEIVEDVPVIDAVGPAVVPSVQVQVVGNVLVSVSVHGTFITP